MTRTGAGRAAIALGLTDETRGQTRVVQANDLQIDTWVAERHYLGSGRWNAVLRLWVLEDDTPVGALLFTLPTGSGIADGRRVWELARMVFVDDTPPFIESRALGLARRHIRRYHSHVKGLIAYASDGEGHEGTVYRADGWFRVGYADGGQRKARGHRDGRADRDLSRKSRWVRTP